MDKQLRLPNIEPPKQLKPAKERPWPVVWVHELVILRELNAGEEFVLRRICLRRGLNILWSKSAERPQPDKLFERGLSGHTAGKTTFCRLLRYVLGEGRFGDESLRSSIRRKFPNGWVAAEVIILGKPWIVCRPLGIGPRGFACRNTTLDKLFDQSIQKEGIGSYQQALDHAILVDVPVKSLLSSGESIQWVHVMPWLTRDQECRYAHLLDWRHGTSESRSPQLDMSDRQFIIRTALGLLSDDELREIGNNARLLAERKGAREKRPLLVHQANADHQRLEEIIDRRLPPLDDGLFGQVAHKELEEKAAIVEKMKAAMQPKSDLNEAEQAMEEAMRREVETARDLEDVQNRLRVETARLTAISRDMTVEERRELFASLPPSRGYCNVPIEIAKAEGCPLSQTRPLDLGIVRAEHDLQEKKEEQERLIGIIQKDIAEKEKTLDHCRSDTASARRKLLHVRTSYEENIWRVAGSEEQVVQLRVLARHAEKAWQEAEDLGQNIERLDNEIKKSREKQKMLREQGTKALAQFSNLFDYIVRAIIGSEVAASAGFSGRGIDLRVDYRGERNSAAIGTIKILCFDLAAMTSSIEGNGSHPRFLVHDCPREADMAPDVYRRFFLFARELENCVFNGNEPNFQYIVTTTEPPPPELLEAPWLLSPVLDASRPEERLLRVDL